MNAYSLCLHDSRLRSQVEAAVALHESLLRPESFPVLLESCFDDGERENILHRLGLRLTDDGSLEVSAGSIVAGAHAVQLYIWKCLTYACVSPCLAVGHASG